MPRRFFFITATLFALTICLCSDADGTRPLPTGLKTYEYAEKSDREMPYEVWSEAGEAYLTDVYYADAAQNEQIIPTGLQLSRSKGAGQVDYLIDRLIYPTIGNPNLYFKRDEDELLVVLRVESELLEALGFRETEGVAGKPFLRLADFEKADDQNEIRFYLIDRRARELTEADELIAPVRGQPAFRILPSDIVAHTNDGVPEVFANRRTLRFAFGRGGVGVRPGLYDLRMEVVAAGRVRAREFQYNAVRVFGGGADRGRYTVLNMTDNQLSVNQTGKSLGSSFRQKTLQNLENLVRFLNSTTDKPVRDAAFLTFNGDLHNGGAPTALLPETVAFTYLKEAQACLQLLRDLPVPIFLVPGNHDGYVSTGHVPESIADSQARESVLHTLFGWLLDSLNDPIELDELITERISPEQWQRLERYLEETDGLPGGWHLDLFAGRFIRRARAKDENQRREVYWKEVPETTRNVILYDGFYQWRRNYGPLNSSWHFGRNHYVNINSFDLRQHRRTGWGMYTVNYGGGVSDFQMHWLRRDIDRNARRDVVLLAHHDPRGGHKGVNYPYYFKQIDYNGMGDSALNYLRGEVINPVLCKTSLKDLSSLKVSCLTDGLQEWMRPDQAFDCRSRYLFATGPRSGMCDRATMKEKGTHSVYSGYQLIHQLASRKQIRTLLLGHTHYNSLEMYLPGDRLIPNIVTLGPDVQKRLAHLEEVSPLRRRSRTMSLDGIIEENNIFRLNLKQTGHNFKKKLDNHELAILRMTTTAELTEQQVRADQSPMDGFTVFEVFAKRDARKYDLPQVNRIYYYQSRPADESSRAANSKNESGTGEPPPRDSRSSDARLYRLVERVDLDRTRRMEREASDNPVQRIFSLPE